MAEIPLNDLNIAQKQAVESEAGPLIVYAGAGSGKTRVLVNRYLKHVLEEGIPPGRILAATFTERAAAEMKERVADSLSDHGRDDLVAQLNAAPISTLHSFCSRLIAPLALDLGIDPGYRILDQHEARWLQEESLTRVLARWRDERSSQLRHLVNRLKWSRDFGLRRGRTPASRGFAQAFISLVEAVRCAGGDLANPFTRLEVDREYIRSLAEELLSSLNALLTDPEGLPAKSGEKASSAAYGLRQYLVQPEDEKGMVYDIAGNLSSISLQVSNVLKPVLKRVKVDLVTLLLGEYFQEDYNTICDILNHLFTDFSTDYQAAKRAAGSLDFLDLEEIALQVLEGGFATTPVVDKILIDEAQDLNPVQWRIINKLGEGAPVFAVGDGQQSIYGFRHADVTLFNQFVQDAEKGTGEAIPLRDNYRSREPVLNAANRFFAMLWKEKSDLPFLKLEKAAQYPETAAAEDDYSVELLIARGATRQAAREDEAEFLARRIYHLVEGGSFQVFNRKGNGELRKAEWSDVRILVRAGSSFEYIETALNRLGIPCIVAAGRGFWDALEITDLMTLVRSLEDPGDSFSLACLLKSPEINFSDDDLLATSIAARDGSGDSETSTKTRRSLYEGLNILSGQAVAESDLPARAERFLTIFDRLYLLKDRLPLRDLVEIWIEETGLESYWATIEHGALMRSNVRKFLRLCDTYAAQPSTRLRERFEEIRIRDLQEGSAADPQAEGGAVQIMTVHAAKGLEAPIVAVFDMNYSPRRSESAFAYARELGGAFCLDGKLPQERFKPALSEAIGEFRKQKEEAENERILYVAMTRAREKLILSSSCTVNRDEVQRTGGWFKTLTKVLKINQEMLFPLNSAPLGFVPLTDEEGGFTGIRLGRAWQMMPSMEDLPSLAPSKKSTFSGPPIGFPSPPGLERGPISVTELLHMQNTLPASVSSEESGLSFDEPSPKYGIALGRWVHRLLQILPLDCPTNQMKETVITEALRLFGRAPDPRELEIVLRLLNNFYTSSTAREIQNARRVFREFPFLFKLEGQYLRAKVDLAFENDRGWILVDYKSDHFDPDSDEPSVFYRDQLLIYSMGWEKLTGKPPAHLQLFYLDSGHGVEIIPTDDERKRIIELLTPAIQGR
jgi:ATP-dependent exoDNAse (exonuclease V) beta subunit